MTKPMTDVSLSKAALVTGISILIMAVAAVVATDITIGSLRVPGDAATTTKNIKASEMLFRTGVFSWLVILICDVLAAWGLYILLKPVNQSLSLLLAWLRLIYAAILGTAMLNFVNVLLLVRGENYLVGFGTDQLQTQVLLSLNAFNETWSIGLVVFGFHILLLGYLVFKSGYLPKTFGVLLIIAFFGYLITNLTKLLYPNYENYKVIIEWIFVLPMVIGEVGLALWLLIKSKNIR